MIAVNTRAEVEIKARELLIDRLEDVTIRLWDAGYTFSKGENSRLRAVTSFDLDRLRAAVEYFERKLRAFQ